MFKIGQKVRCVESNGNRRLKKGEVYTVSEITDDHLYINGYFYYKYRFEPVEDTPKVDTDKIHYALGYRDATATILAETKDKVKLPDIAKYYAENFEKHWAHDWHVS